VKIALYTNVTAFEAPGGAEIYFLNLLNTLRQLKDQFDVEVDLYDPLRKSIAYYDVAVFYNSTAHSALAYDFLLVAKRAKKRTVNIPVYFSLHFSFSNIEKFLYTMGLLFVRLYIERTGILFRSKLEFLYKSLHLAELILVSGEGEAKVLNRDFKIDKQRIEILPVAVEEKFANSDPNLFIEKYGVSDFILYVGKIAKRKNVLSLIKAYKIACIDAPLVIVGHIAEYDYYQQVLEYIKKHNLFHKILIIPGLDHSSELLASAYAASRVLVLPSYYETPGIAALEAALTGTNIVITKYGTTMEYFKHYALYVDPYNIKDIAHKLEIAYNRPKPNTKLREYILNNFTYTRVARRLITLLYRLINQYER